MSYLSLGSLLYPFSGLVVGLLVGLTGVGGGSLMTPLLILLFGVHPQTAVGTDLLFAAATKSVGTAVHGVSRSVEWRVVGLLAMGSLPASAVTVYTVSVLGPANGSTEVFISNALGIVLALTALGLIAREHLLRRSRSLTRALSPTKRRVATFVTGVLLGVLVSLTSVGVGALGVTALVILYPDLALVRIVRSDIAHAMPLTLVAGIGHWLARDVNVALCGTLLLGSIPGILLGSYVATRASDTVLRFSLATVLAVVAGRLMTS